MFEVKSDPIGWNQLKKNIQMRWGEVNDTELDHTDGDINKITAIVQLRYGQDPQKIKQWLLSFLTNPDVDINSDNSERLHHQEGVSHEYNSSVTDTNPNFRNSIDQRYL